MQMPQKGAQAEDDEYEAMTSLGHHDIHELFSSGCDKATLKKLGLLLQLLPSEIEVSHSDAKSGPKHKKKLAAHEEGKEETETPAGTSSRLFPKALASALEAAGTRGPESSAAGVSAAKRARKVGAAAERDEGEEVELDAYNQAEAEAKRPGKVGAAAEKDEGDDAELDAYDQAEFDGPSTPQQTALLIDSYTMDAEFAYLLFNLRTPVARAVEIVGLKRAVISRINEEGAVIDGELRLQGSYMRAAPGSPMFWLAWLRL